MRPAAAVLGRWMAWRLAVACIAASVGGLAIPAAGTAAQLTAVRVRIGDHAAYVRAVLDFTGGRLAGNQVQLEALRTSAGTVRVVRAKVATHAPPRTAYGVSVRVIQGAAQLRIEIRFASQRIKYLSYAIVNGTRLAIDLWKSTPPSKTAEMRSGPGGCLVLRTWQVTAGVVSVNGSERNIFENTFQVLVRGADGSVLGRRISMHGPGKWSASVHYRASHGQSGTLEAVAFSPKDGSLECLAQVRITLPIS